MRILCCYTDLHPATRQSLPPGTELVQTAGDAFAYWRALRERWAQDDLVVIEHDVVIHEGVLPAFAACRSPWCAFPYKPYEYSARGMLGCVRFSLEAQHAVPAAEISRAFGDCPEHGRRSSCWHQLADQVSNAIEARGLSVCEHYPLVTHYKEWPGKENPENVESPPRYR